MVSGPDHYDIFRGLLPLVVLASLFGGIYLLQFDLSSNWFQFLHLTISLSPYLVFYGLRELIRFADRKTSPRHPGDF